MWGSKLFQSKYSKEELEATHKKLKAVQYPVAAISIAMILRKKLNNVNASIRNEL